MKMKCPEEMIGLMHEYLDEHISQEKENILRNHLQTCLGCQSYFHKLKKTIALVQSTSHVQAPHDFTTKVMQSLPKEKKTIGFQRWLKEHPFITAASLFVLFMTGSLFSYWSENQQFSVSKQPNLVVENHTVIVPKGEVVNGDIIVRNGKIEIEGTVQGNITIINGEKYMASAGQVTGDIEEVDEIFEWLWYQIKSTFVKTFNLQNNDETNL